MGRTRRSAPLGLGRVQRLAAAALRVASRGAVGPPHAGLALAATRLARPQAPGLRWAAGGAPPADLSIASAPAPKLDPERPRTPATAFVLFSKERWRTLPKMPLTTGAQLLSQEWNSMTDEEKGPYVQQSDSAFREYDAELAEYRRSGKEAIWKAREGRTSVRKLLSMDPERPKQPPNSYALFLAEAASNTGVPAQQHNAGVTQTWKDMGDEEKAVYQEKAKDLMRAHKEEMAEYVSSGRAAMWREMVERHLPGGRPLGAFQLFHADLRETAPSVTEAVAREVWESKMSDADRAPYTDLAGRNRARRKAAVDPERPKGPLTAFVLFQQEWQKEHRGLKLTEMAKAAGKRWAEMGDPERLPYRQQEARLRQEYNARMREYRASGKEAAWDADGPVPEDPEKPRKPRTAWNIFQAEAKASGVSAASAKWRSMTADEQAVYRARAAAEKEAYEKKMAAYSSSGKAAAWVQKVTELRRAGDDVPEV